MISILDEDCKEARRYVWRAYTEAGSNAASGEDDAGMIHGDGTALAALEEVGESRLLTYFLAGSAGDAGDADDAGDAGDADAAGDDAVGADNADDAGDAGDDGGVGGAGGGNDFPGRSLLSLLSINFTQGYEQWRRLTQRRRRCERLSLSALLRSNVLLYNAGFRMCLRLRSESFKVPIEKSLALFWGWQ